MALNHVLQNTVDTLQRALFKPARAHTHSSLLLRPPRESLFYSNSHTVVKKLFLLTAALVWMQ